MILRKPYAVFIKYFKLLHAVLAVFLAFILYRSVALYNFFRIYSIDYRSATGNFTVDRYMPSFTFAFVVIILLITTLLLFVTIYKKKPKMLYIYNLGVYILVFVLYFICLSTLKDINSTLLDIRVSKGFRDFALIAAILQSVSFILVVVRATGFDIKSFDFGSDLQKLDISEKDSEEIEVALEFDKDALIRNYKAKIRNLKYVYAEKKFLINSAVLIIVLGIAGLIYFNVKSYNKTYNENQTFSVSGITMNIKDSFVVDSNSSDVKIVDTSGDNPGVVVAVRFEIKGYEKEFNTGLINLRIGEFSYSQNRDLAKQLSDLGEVYTNQKITNEFQTYILAFEIPEAFSNKQMTLKVNDSNSFLKGEFGLVNSLVNLNVKDLRKDGQRYEKNISETINFDDSILGSSTLLINSFEINNKFKLNYKYCYAKDKCMDSSEYITPTASGNYFKTLMKINGQTTIDQNNNIDSVYDLRTLLNEFGTINYKINDNWVSKKIDSKQIKTSSAQIDADYIEVPYEIKNASKINLSIDIRNQHYKYTLK